MVVESLALAPPIAMPPLMPASGSARQMGGEQRDLELTPELELELRRLRKSLGN
ncbi:MAG: hypothetical protein GY769_14305 [bacterium]|nr:hypothetical protein [bacterium]